MRPHPDQTAQGRLTAGRERDADARVRDIAAHARDDVATDARSLDLPDDQVGRAEELGRSAIGLAETILRAAGLGGRAKRDRALAGEQQQLASRDRRAAAVDRELAERERRYARADREALASLLALTDPLTGARMRAAGLTDLERELVRCHRTGGRIVVVYVDVIGMKTINDTEGHAAGDELLTAAVRHIKTHLRPYDLIVRIGGDEFVCAMPWGIDGRRSRAVPRHLGGGHGKHGRDHYPDGLRRAGDRRYGR